MPYNSQGNTTAEAKIKIDINMLIREGYIKKGALTIGTITWSSGKNDEKSIGFACEYSDLRKNFRVVYQAHDRTEGTRDYDYCINIAVVKSNLGKGKIPYFVCPVTYSLCRILYFSHETQLFCSRKAFGESFFYECQVKSKRWYANERYHKTTAELKRIAKRRIIKTYTGLETRRYKRFKRLQNLQQEYQLRRIGNMGLILDSMKRAFEN